MSLVTIFDIKRFAVHDGPGIRTTVFFKGCPLDCWWCHNPESRNSDPEDVIYKRQLGDKEIEYRQTYGKSIGIKDLLKGILKDRLFFEESGGGVTFSGGEPLSQSEALLELLQHCKQHGIHTTVDTCGYAQWSNFKKIIPFTDLFLFDLKLMETNKHEKFTGMKNELIIKNLVGLLSNQANVELRIPVIPGVNNSVEEINKFIEFLNNGLNKVPKIHLLPYHNSADKKYQKLDMENRMDELVNDHGMGLEYFKQALESAGFAVGIGG